MLSFAIGSANYSPERPNGWNRTKGKRNQFDLQITFARTVLDDLHREIGAHGTFKGALIVIRLLRLYARQPHLRSAKFTKWSANDPLLRKNLIPSHATPPEQLARIPKLDTYKGKKRVSSGDRS
jgi:hypothetical protein